MKYTNQELEYLANELTRRVGNDRADFKVIVDRFREDVSISIDGKFNAWIDSTGGVGYKGAERIFGGGDLWYKGPYNLSVTEAVNYLEQYVKRELTCKSKLVGPDGPYSIGDYDY